MVGISLVYGWCIVGMEQNRRKSPVWSLFSD
jgi:hypothetical protein